MDDGPSKRTRKIIVASVFWLAFSYYLADTNYGYYDLSFYDVSWEVFIVLSAPVWIYWAYYWINKGK